MSHAAIVVEMPALDVAQLFRDHGAFVGRVILRLAGPGPHVDDLLQETFVVAHKKRNAFDGRASVTTWLYGIASHLCMHHHRSNRRFRLFRERLDREQTLQQPEPPDEHVTREQGRAAVHAALAQLPHKVREVFVLFELEGMSGHEVSELLQLPLGTVWTRLRKGRQLFEKAMRRSMNAAGKAGAS